MQLYFLKNNTGITYSALPIKENGVEGTLFEVADVDLAKVEAGTHYFDLVDGQPVLIELI